MKTRHIVFTYDSVSKCQDDLNAELKYCSIEMNSALTYLEKKKLVTDALCTPDHDAIILQFPNISSRKNIEAIKYMIDDLSSSAVSVQRKVVILMVHYSKSDLQKEPERKLARA